MDKKTERKWRMRRLRLSAALFFRKNGLYLAAAFCLAAIGLAAALIFTDNGSAPSPVNRSDDERLAEAVSPSPAPVDEPTLAPSPEPATQEPDRTALPLPLVSLTPIPDFTPAPEETPDPSLSKLQPPVDGSVIRVFAVNSLIWSETLQQWMTHPGVDIAANKGDEVYAVMAGSVSRVYTDDMLGVTVVLAHENGMESVYSGLKDVPPVKEGDSVSARAVIGYIGDTALSECAERSHLHFELRFDGAPIDPEGLMIFNKA